MIVSYLLDTRDKSIIFRPDLTRGLECLVGAEFAGSLKNGDHDCRTTVFSRTGCAIVHGGYPIIWGNELQSEIAPSTTESEYIALLIAIREVIPFLGLTEEITSVFSLLKSILLFGGTL